MTNQKSLDKKKELSKCCNAPIEKLNDWGAEYMGCSKCFSAQSLDKKKTKELEYVITWVMAKANGIDDYNWGQKQFEKDLRKKLELLLTQQRTELLKLVNKAFEETVIESEGHEYGFYEKLNNLLNEKND